MGSGLTSPSEAQKGVDTGDGGTRDPEAKDERREAGAARGEAPAQTARMSSAALCPPNPYEQLSAVSTRASRGFQGT